MSIVRKIRYRLGRPHELVADVRKAFFRLTKPSVVSIQGVDVPLGEHLSPMVTNDLYGGSYELEELRILRKRLSRDEVVVELGGGIGFLSAFCAAKLDSNKVSVYEANPALEGPIRELYRLNRVDPTLNMYALGSGDGELELLVSEHFCESSTSRKNARLVVGKVRVPVKDFDTELSNGTIKPNFLICDIEGGEYELFVNCKLHGISKILCEVHPGVLGEENIRKMREALFSKSFELLETSPNGRVWYLERA